MMDLKKTLYWNIFSDVFVLMKNLLPPQESDEYWKQVVDQCGGVYKKYKDTEQKIFCKKLIFAVADEIEQNYRREMKQ